MQPSASSNGTTPRVLLVTKHRTGGGTEKHVADLVAGLSGRIAVDAAYLEDGFWPLQRRIERELFDIVHFFLPRPYVLGTLACWLARSPAVRIMSRRSLRSCYQTPRIQRVERFLHKRTKILVGNSPAVCYELRDEAPNADIRLIRNGCNPLAAGRGVPLHEHKGLFRIVCVANAFRYKGLEDLIEATRLAYMRVPQPFVVNLAGRDTERLTVKPLNIYGLGYRNSVQIEVLLRLADLFVLPSHEEGSSNALLEAMAAGVPVIATDVGGNRDAVEHGFNGVLVPVCDPGRLADAIAWAVKCPQQFQTMAANAKKVVATKFGFERMLDEYEALYRSAVKGA